MSPITIRLRQYRGGVATSRMDRIRTVLNRVVFRVPFGGHRIPIRWGDLVSVVVTVAATWVALVVVLALDLLLN